MTVECSAHPERFLFDCDPPPRAGQRPTVTADRIVHAKTVCARCWNVAACLSDELAAMRDGATTFGIFGGTTPGERVAILRRRNAA